MSSLLQIKKRFKECSKQFCSEFNIENISEDYELMDSLSNKYFFILSDYIRKILKEYNLEEHNVDRHKIISLSQFVILNEKPFENPELNYSFSLFIGFKIILLWGEKLVEDLTDKNLLVPYDKLESFMLEHKKWLRKVNLFLDINHIKYFSFPILSNSATWYSIEKNIYLYSELEQLKN